MKYLCSHHLNDALSHPLRAEQLWRQAMDCGHQARKRQQWEVAKNGFGTAFDIAFERHMYERSNKQRSQFLLLESLFDALRHFIPLLCITQNRDEAADVYRKTLAAFLCDANSYFGAEQKRQLLLWLDQVEQLISQVKAQIGLGRGSFSDFKTTKQNRSIQRMRRDCLQ